MDKGSWTWKRTGPNVDVFSDDFMLDVALRISGDFESDAQADAYAAWLAESLNRRPTPEPQGEAVAYYDPTDPNPHTAFMWSALGQKQGSVVPLYTRPQPGEGGGEVIGLPAKWRNETHGALPQEQGWRHKVEGYNAALLDCADELNALLRKLQQGADYVMVPRVPTQEMLDAFCRLEPDEITEFHYYGGLTGYDHYTTEEGAKLAWETMIAASQGQEGGANG